MDEAATATGLIATRAVPTRVLVRGHPCNGNALWALFPRDTGTSAASDPLAGVLSQPDSYGTAAAGAANATTLEQGAYLGGLVALTETLFEPFDTSLVPPPVDAARSHRWVNLIRPDRLAETGAVVGGIVAARASVCIGLSLAACRTLRVWDIVAADADLLVLTSGGLVRAPAAAANASLSVCRRARLFTSRSILHFALHCGGGNVRDRCT